MAGGKPGYYPTFDLGEPRADLSAPPGWGIPHPCPFNLYDPFGASKQRTAEQKANGLLVEINNGRLAMLGIMAFLSEAKIPGAVPALTGAAATTPVLNAALSAAEKAAESAAQARQEVAKPLLLVWMCFAVPAQIWARW